MALRLVTSAAVVGVAAGTINLSISDCGDSSTHGKVSGISPTSVGQGTKTLVTGTGVVDTAVTDGDYNVNVKVLGVSVTTCKADLCGASKCALPASTGSIDFRGLSCPQSAGTVSLGFDVTVSRTVPSSLAILDIEITSMGSAGKLICATIHTSPGLDFVIEDASATEVHVMLDRPGDSLVCGPADDADGVDVGCCYAWDDECYSSYCPVMQGAGSCNHMPWETDSGEGYTSCVVNTQTCELQCYCVDAPTGRFIGNTADLNKCSHFENCNGELTCSESPDFKGCYERTQCPGCDELCGFHANDAACAKYCSHVCPQDTVV